MQLLKLVQSQVRLGVPLLWGVRDGEGHLLLARGQVVHSEAQLASLLSRGASVDEEEVKAVAAARSETVEARPVSLFGLWEKLIWRLERALKSITEEAGFAARLEDVAQHLVMLAERDTDIAIFLAVRQDQARFSVYGLTHSLHVALICFLMARRMDWPRERVLTLVKAALSMNIAIIELQGRLAAQGVPPTASQRDVLKEHPQKAVEMLQAAGVTDSEWLQAVAQHHEHADGSGYPLGLTTDGICELARALHLADVFMAKLSPRAIRTSVPAQEAARQLFQANGGGEMTMAIIKEIGIYPPGEFVKLKSGELAVVVRRSESASMPIAASITDKSGIPSVNTVRRDTSRPEYAITAMVADKALVARVQPERLYGLQT